MVAVVYCGVFIVAIALVTQIIYEHFDQAAKHLYYMN
jgi:hypothetical protein